MARNGITRDQVVEAAERLQREGRNVSVANVRALLGGTGSYTTISGHLKGWRQEREGPTQAAPKELERSVVGLFGRLWRSLMLGVDKEVKRKTDGRFGTLESELHTSENDIRQLQEECHVCRAEVETLQLELRQLREEQARLSARLDTVDKGD